MSKQVDAGKYSQLEVWDGITGMWCILHTCDTAQEARLYGKQEQRLDAVHEQDGYEQRTYRVVTTTTEGI